MNTRKPAWSKAFFSLFSGLAPLLGTMMLYSPGCAPPKPVVVPAPVSVPWLGFHVLIESKAAAEALIAEIPALAARGVNLLIVEIDYNYEYASHPELRGDDPISAETVKKIVGLCRDLKIRLVPEFQSLGHQSWEGKTFPLLTKHPEFDETPGQYPGNKDIYCRSWCPLHPEVNPIIFDLFDEIMEVFEADALHVGMDEVFLIGSEYCPLCRGKDPAELFAKAVNDCHDHIVKKRGKEMMMWGDRLLDGVKTGYGEWEASTNSTFPAVDLIPKDIIICDWHYEIMPGNAYPSIPFFLEKGFRVLPTSFENVQAANALIDYSLKYRGERMLGHLGTIWKGPEVGKTSQYPPLLAATAKMKGTERPGSKGAAGAKILANQVGYDLLGPKRAVILGHAGDAFDQFVVRDAATGETVLTGVPGLAGPVARWKDWVFWTMDFSPVAREGTFMIEAVSPKGGVRSHTLRVGKNILERETLSDVIYYFKGQRSSGALDRADRTMTFDGREGTVDARGGWFDATGDYGKHLSHLSFSTFFNPQQIPLTAWSLFKSYRELSGRGDPNFRQYLRRLLDEAIFGADFLVRFKNPSGSFYMSVSGRGPEKKPEDRRITPKAERHLILTAETKNQFRDYGREKIQGQAAYEAGYREGAGLAIAA
ncbi:MAG: family 20 glycosylhydrolase, partial [Candidatus Aminicenantales bacterium]